jgi:hypothetical protein
MRRFLRLSPENPAVVSNFQILPKRHQSQQTEGEMRFLRLVLGAANFRQVWHSLKIGQLANGNITLLTFCRWL